ncbi:MAG: MFS transporter [Planctomycetes bacterium]|nr:MFS transporter [Planctomycetota bacterium]
MTKRDSVTRRDIPLLFASRSVRLFAYGAVSVVLGLLLGALGFSEFEIGLLLTLTLLGDTAVTLLLATHADRFGRRRTLVAGAALMLAAGVVFALSDSYLVLLAAAIVGVISPSGSEVGPFLAVEQAALAQTVGDARRTRTFAWHTLLGSVATAFGALAGGGVSDALRGAGLEPVQAYRSVVVGYALLGAVLGMVAAAMSRAVELPPERAGHARVGLGSSRGKVLRLSALFAVDAFAGGLVLQAMVAFWLHARFGMQAVELGTVFLATNMLSGVSALVAARIAERFGLINTMVFTHIPANVLLLLVPFMPNAWLAVGLLIARSLTSQMDVPTRQSYVMAVVAPAERSAAAGVTAVARTLGSGASPVLAGLLMGREELAGLPFVLAGGLKIAYDLALFALFRRHRPPEEHAR